MKDIKIDTKALSMDLVVHRSHSNRLSLREASKECKISHVTLSRLERGTMPDLKSYARACKWMGVDLSSYIK